MNDFNKYQCKGCQKDFFGTTTIYKWGKDKHTFCHDCNEKNKSRCSWCERVLSCQPSSSYDKKCYLHHHGRTKEMYDNGSKIEHEAFCDENCQGEFQKYQENTPEKAAERQQRQELLDKGYKPCGKNLIPFESIKIDCNNLIPPSEKYCENCQKLEKEREENIKKRRSENEQAWVENENKVKEAQNWWISLSKEEKLAEIKKIEQAWIKKAGGDNFHGYMGDGTSGSRIEFKNDSLHVYPEDLSKIPPPLLEKFGIDVTTLRSKNFFPVGDSYSEDLQTQISRLESKLQNAKMASNKNEINKLEQELKKLKSQQKENTNNEKSPLKYWIIGISLISVLLLGIIIILKVKDKRKKMLK